MKDNNLTHWDIPSQIRMIAIPSSVGFFFNTMYNVVDTYFWGLISTDALAALSLSFPVFFIILALSFWLATWATALISNALWEENEEKARLYAMQAISFSIIASFILTIVWYFIAPYLFKILWAEWIYLDLALEYTNIILIGSVFFCLTFVINGILNSRGDSKTFRNFLIVWFFLNCILDPLFVFWFFWIPWLGLAWVAWATILIEFLWVIYMWSIIVKINVFCKGCHKMLVPQKEYFKEIFEQWFPASLNMLTVAIGIFIITYFVAPFWKVAVAAYGITTRIDQIAIVPSVWLNTAALALIWQNNWAKKYNRCREIYRLIMIYWFYLAVFWMLLVALFAKELINLFTDDLEVINVWVNYLYISIFVYWAYVILYSVTSILQWLKKPNFALRIWLYRQILAPIIIFYLFTNIIFNWINGVWWWIFMINWSAVIITIIYSRYIFNKLPNK